MNKDPEDPTFVVLLLYRFVTVSDLYEPAEDGKDSQVEIVLWCLHCPCSDK